MPRVLEISQDIHQPIYDTLVRNIGITNVTNGQQLFGSQNNGQRALTNLFSPGSLTSDQVYLVRAIRFVTNFQGLADPEFTNAYGQISALAGVTSDNVRAQDLYPLVLYGANFTFQTDGKDYLQAPAWYAPAGGGPTGFSSNSSRHTITNGLATQQAILKLAKPVRLSPRQGFGVKVDFFPFARTATATGQGGAINIDIDPLLFLNQFDGLKVIQVHLDGVLTRDVQ